MTARKEPEEAAGVRILGRSIGRVQCLAVVAAALCLSAAASLVERASLPFWANLAALCLALLLSRGVFIHLSKPNTKYREARESGQPRSRRATRAADLTDGLARAPLARPLDHSDVRERRVP